MTYDDLVIIVDEDHVLIEKKTLPKIMIIAYYQKVFKIINKLTQIKKMTSHII